MPPTNRRPYAIDTAMPFCPHAGCDYRSWLGLGNLRANGHPSGGPWRQLYGHSCHGGFDHRAGHFQPPGVVEGIAKLPVLEGLKCFYLGPSSAGVAGAMIMAGLGILYSMKVYIIFLIGS
jgi:hypothetical protein